MDKWLKHPITVATDSSDGSGELADKQKNVGKQIIIYLSLFFYLEFDFK